MLAGRDVRRLRVAQALDVRALRVGGRLALHLLVRRAHLRQEAVEPREDCRERARAKCEAREAWEAWARVRGEARGARSLRSGRVVDGAAPLLEAAMVFSLV